MLVPENEKEEHFFTKQLQSPEFPQDSVKRQNGGKSVVRRCDFLRRDSCGFLAWQHPNGTKADHLYFRIQNLGWISYHVASFYLTDTNAASIFVLGGNYTSCQASVLL